MVNTNKNKNKTYYTFYDNPMKTEALPVDVEVVQ